MADKLFGFVLEDDLLVEYHKFMNPQDSKGNYDKDLLKKLLSYHVYPFLYNKKQVDRLGLDVSQTMKVQMTKSNLKNYDLTKLADYTVFKCILSKNEDGFPYVNIYGDKVKASITGTFFSSENRDKARAHIKELCKDARSITLHDKYLSKAEVHNICALLPQRKGLVIRIHNKNISEKTITTYCSSDVKSELCNYCSQWTVEPVDLLVNSHHDRYLIIDDSLVVVLTSGFSNLFSEQKDFSYVISHMGYNPLVKE